MAAIQYGIAKIHIINKGSLKGFADVTFNSTWLIKGFRILETAKDGGSLELWVSKPSEKNGDKYYDTVYPIIDGEMEIVSKLILDEYKSRLGTTQTVPNPF